MALIVCKECGQQISDQAVMCPNCGCPVQPNEMGETKSETLPPPPPPPHQAPPVPPVVAPKDKTVAAILAILLGSYGIHHFYVGNNDRGVSYLVVGLVLTVIYLLFGLVTVGIGYAIPLPLIFTVICLIDAIHYLSDDDAKFQERIAREKDALWKKIIY